MRLVRQYRSDPRTLIIRLAVLVTFLACTYILVGRLAYAVATSYYDFRDEEHDRTVLSQLAQERAPAALNARIHQKEAILKQLRNETMIRKVRSDLAKLYEEKGIQSIALAKQYEAKGATNLADTQRSLAEFNYQRATEFAPSNPDYYADMARLLLSASRQQNDRDKRYDLLRNAVDEFQEAVDLQHAVAPKQALGAEDAQCRLELAAVELSIPKYRADAIVDLQKAIKLALPGSTTSKEVAKLIQTAE